MSSGVEGRELGLGMGQSSMHDIPLVAGIAAASPPSNGFSPLLKMSSQDAKPRSCSLNPKDNTGIPAQCSPPFVLNSRQVSPFPASPTHLSHPHPRDGMLRSELESRLMYCAPSELIIAQPMSNESSKLLGSYVSGSKGVRAETSATGGYQEGGALAAVTKFYGEHGGGWRWIGDVVAGVSWVWNFHMCWCFV